MNCQEFISSSYCLVWESPALSSIHTQLHGFFSDSTSDQNECVGHPHTPTATCTMVHNQALIANRNSGTSEGSFSWQVHTEDAWVSKREGKAPVCYQPHNCPQRHNFQITNTFLIRWLPTASFQQDLYAFEGYPGRQHNNRCSFLKDCSTKLSKAASVKQLVVRKMSRAVDLS